jgi:hypothetical protein
MHIQYVGFDNAVRSRIYAFHVIDSPLETREFTVKVQAGAFRAGSWISPISKGAIRKTCGLSSIKSLTFTTTTRLESSAGRFEQLGQSQARSGRGANSKRGSTDTCARSFGTSSRAGTHLLAEQLVVWLCSTAAMTKRTSTPSLPYLPPMSSTPG